MIAGDMIRGAMSIVVSTLIGSYGKSIFSAAARLLLSCCKERKQRCGCRSSAPCRVGYPLMSVYTKKHDLPTYPEPPGNPIYLVRKPLLTVTPTLPRPYLPIASAKRASTDTLPGKEPRTCAAAEHDYSRNRPTPPTPSATMAPNMQTPQADSGATAHSLHSAPPPRDFLYPT